MMVDDEEVVECADEDAEAGEERGCNDDDGEGGEEPSPSEYSEYNEDDDEDPLQQISQLLITEDGEAVSDVLQGIRDALDKQNKILFKLCGLLDR